MPASILIIDDEPKMGKALKHVLDSEGYQVDVVDDARLGLGSLGDNSYQVLLCDLKMPGLSGLDVLEQSKARQPDLIVIMMTAYASAETAVESMKKGAYDYLIKPFSTDELKILIERAVSAKALEEENRLLKEQLSRQFHPPEIISVSKAMQSVLKRTGKVAPSNATVLIYGESGTGKEILARAIHGASPRSDKPLVTVNCGALTETLLESELFGHHRGAFTGAVETRAGLFEAADKGTVFLDEIGEISPAMQIKLLRVLQSGDFQRVGDPTVRRVDVRIVAATNQDLQQMVAAGRFRTDLFYRLNVVPIYIPPLRERREDIAPLIDHFLVRHGEETVYRFSSEALEIMEGYDWPGNIRELENAIEHAVVLSDGESLTIDALPVALRSFAGHSSQDPGLLRLDKMTLEEAEKRMIQGALDRTDNNMTRAAKQLGVTRRTLGYRLRKYGLYHGPDKEDEPEEDRTDELSAKE